MFITHLLSIKIVSLKKGNNLPSEKYIMAEMLPNNSEKITYHKNHTRYLSTGFKFGTFIIKIVPLIAANNSNTLIGIT